MYSILEFWPVVLVIGIVLFFVLRKVSIWYWKIDEFIKGQEEQIRLLKKIAGEKEAEESPENINKILSIVIMCCLATSVHSQTINGGNDHSIMLCDSLVWTVGSNTAGQLGDGTTVNKLTPVKVNGLTDIISVQAGSIHCTALQSDGTVWSWGDNTFGQLGTNSTTPSSIPVQVSGLSNIVKIVAGGFYNIALENDSTTWMWGDNSVGQINGANPDKLFPIPAGGINVIDIDAGGRHTMILKANGSVWSQGANDFGQLGFGNIGLSSSTLKQVGDTSNLLVNIIAIAAGDSHSLALKTDSTILAWGRNQYGQLGDSTTVNNIVPVQVVGLTNVISIKGGQRHSIALKSDGTVWTWGWNGLGQLGDNTLIDKLTPIQVPGLDSVVEIAAGSHHCMAKRSDSTIWVWGNNISGQLGNDTAINTTVPVQMMLSCVPYQCPAPQVYSGGDLTICSEDSIMIFGTYQQVANNYYDSLLTSNGCDSIIEIGLILDSLPTVSFTGLNTSYCIDSTITIDTLIGTPSGGVFSGTGVVSGVFNPFATGFGTFDITYSYTDSNGCTGIETQSVTISNCTSIEYLEYEDFKIYPNPSTGIVNIQTTQQIEISNILGYLIYKGMDKQIDLSEYGKGIYFVRVGATIKKLIITD